MGQLTNLYVSESYQGLLKLADSTTGVTSTLQHVQDGLGVNTPLQISQTEVNISGSFYINNIPITNGSSGTSGTSGQAGSSGTSGTSGVAGSSGTSGQNGSSGTSGTSGVAGSSGTSGTSGSNGSSGTSGSSGQSGSSGTSGTSGSNGSSGTSGVDGSSGTSGTSGTSPDVSGFATTGSNTFLGSQIIIDDLTVSGSVNLGDPDVIIPDRPLSTINLGNISGTTGDWNINTINRTITIDQTSLKLPTGSFLKIMGTNSIGVAPAAIQFHSGSEGTRWINMQPVPGGGGDVAISDFPTNNHFMQFEIENHTIDFEAPLKSTGSASIEILNGLILGNNLATVNDEVIGVRRGKTNINGAVNITGTTVITGSLFVSSSVANDVTVEGRVLVFSNAGAGNIPTFTVSGSYANAGLSVMSPGTISAISGSFAGSVSKTNIAHNDGTGAPTTTRLIGMSANPSLIGAPSLTGVTVPSIYAMSGSNLPEAVISFQHRGAYTDGRITMRKPVDFQSGSIITGSVNITGSINLSNAIVAGAVVSGFITGAFYGDGSGLNGITASLPDNAATTGSNAFFGDNSFEGVNFSVSSSFRTTFSGETKFMDPVQTEDAIFFVGGPFDPAPYDNGVSAGIYKNTENIFSFVHNKIGTPSSGSYMYLTTDTGSMVNNARLNASSDGDRLAQFLVQATPTGSHTYSKADIHDITGSVQITGSLSIADTNDLTMYGHKMFNVGQFQQNSTLSGSANVSQSISYDVTDVTYGISLVSGSRITYANAGVYSTTFSAQLLADAGADTVYMWLKKNGTNVPESATKLTLDNNKEAVMTINFVTELAANDYLEIAWQSTNGDAVIYSEAASGNIPAIPSIITSTVQVR